MLVVGTELRTTALDDGRFTLDVYVDGVRAYDGASDLDVLVRPEDVLGVEMYRSGAGVPAEFATTQAAHCGVLIVWTKR